MVQLPITNKNGRFVWSWRQEEEAMFAMSPILVAKQVALNQFGFTLTSSAGSAFISRVKSIPNFFLQ